MANEVDRVRYAPGNTNQDSRYRAWRLRIFAITWMSYAGF